MVGEITFREILQDMELMEQVVVVGQYMEAGRRQEKVGLVL